MTINEHLTEFGGLQIVDYGEGTSETDPTKTAYRLMLNWEMSEEGKTFIDLFGNFLSEVDSSQVRALLVGDWGEAGTGNDSAPVVEALVSARDKLPNLRSLFLGEMVMEESEISWIQQSDVSPLFDAWPSLEALHLRGGNGLRLGSPQHLHLKKLVIETGGLPAAVLHDLYSAKLPQLEHLELWLGTDEYGNDISVDDVRKLLASPCCQKLTYLGLRDDVHADATAQTLREVDIPMTLRTLDLSLGTLGDEGATALLNAPWIAQISLLDFHHHYVSQQLVEQLKSKFKSVNAEELCEEAEWGGERHRYVSVAE